MSIAYLGLGLLWLIYGVVTGSTFGWLLLIEGFSWLQGLYLLTGSVVIVASIRLTQATTTVPVPQTVAPTRDDQKGLR